MTLLRPALGLRVYDQPSAFSFLEDEWKLLFRRHGGWNVFLSWQWFDRWWACFGGGRDLQIAVLADEDHLVGIAPMMVEMDDRGNRRLALIGSDRTTDYGDLLVDPEHRVAFTEALADLVADGFDRWGSAEFRALQETSSLLGAFAPGWVSPEIEAAHRFAESCPRVRLQPTWDEYLAILGKKDRHELRRKIRRARAAGDQEVVFLTSPEEVAAGLESFFRLHRASDPEKASFLDVTTESFFREVFLAFAREGWTQLGLMRLDGREVAASVSFTRGDRVLLYNSGLDPDYRVHSVGIALHAAEIQRAIEQGKAWYDFLRGNEPYKYGFGAQDVPIYRLTLRPVGTGSVEANKARG